MGCQVTKGEIQNHVDFFPKIKVNLGKHFLITSISITLYFQKSCPIFDGSPFMSNHKIHLSILVN